MNIKAFEGLEGKKLSVLLNKNKPSGEPESYIAYLSSIGNGYVVFDYSKASYYPDDNPIDQLIIDVSIIQSLWVYKDIIPKKNKAELRDKHGLGYPKSIKGN